jgi:hypothetical protein
MLTWEGGRWAHKYDVYFGTNQSNLPLIASDVITGTFGSEGSESYLVSGLQMVQGPVASTKADAMFTVGSLRQLQSCETMRRASDI